MKPQPRPQPHPGSDYTNRGCRCENCTAYNREKQRRYTAGISRGTRGTVCDLPGCARPVYARGMCRLHWNRDQYGGLPLSAPVRGEACKHGHWYTPENTYVKKDGGKQCRECDRLRHQRSREAKRLALV